MINEFTSTEENSYQLQKLRSIDKGKKIFGILALKNTHKNKGQICCEQEGLLGKKNFPKLHGSIVEVEEFHVHVKVHKI